MEHERETDSLTGQRVLITGASRGLGASLARQLHQAGAKVGLFARPSAELQRLGEDLDGSLVLPGDVREREDMEGAVSALCERWGGLDIHINNAGLAVYGPVLDCSEEAIHRMLDTNVKGVIFGSQAALRVMREQGQGLIINISSIAGKLHLPQEAVYNASKWAVNGFTGTLRLEAEPYGVKVSCVCPGGINTPFWEGMSSYPFPDSIRPERDFMDPEEVAGSVLQICRASAGYIVPEIVMLPMRPAHRSP